MTGREKLESNTVVFDGRWKAERYATETTGLEITGKVCPLVSFAPTADLLREAICCRFLRSNESFRRRLSVPTRPTHTKKKHTLIQEKNSRKQLQQAMVEHKDTPTLLLQQQQEEDLDAAVQWLSINTLPPFCYNNKQEEDLDAAVQWYTQQRQAQHETAISARFPRSLLRRLRTALSCL